MISSNIFVRKHMCDHEFNKGGKNLHTRKSIFYGMFKNLAFVMFIHVLHFLLSKLKYNFFITLFIFLRCAFYYVSDVFLNNKMH